jgi:hypothetical protein
MSLLSSTDECGLLREAAVAIHDRAGDVNHVMHHGRSSTSVTYTQASTVRCGVLPQWGWLSTLTGRKPLLLLCRRH